MEVLAGKIYVVYFGREEQMMKKFLYLFQCVRGATSIEYGLIAGGISLTIVAAVFFWGDELQSLFEAIATPLDDIAAEAETGRTT